MRKTLTGEKNSRYTRKAVPCTVCGKDVLATPYRIEHTQNIFCSRECYREYFHNYVEGEKNAHWKGGHSRYRADFERVKRKYFSKKQFCALCGTTKRINIHHIIPYRLTQDNSIDNLIPLCASHHKKVECFTAPIYENWEDKEMAKDCLNIILRARQKTTQAVVHNLLKKRKRENEQGICETEAE